MFFLKPSSFPVTFTKLPRHVSFSFLLASLATPRSSVVSLSFSSSTPVVFDQKFVLPWRCSSIVSSVISSATHLLLPSRLSPVCHVFVVWRHCDTGKYMFFNHCKYFFNQNSHTAQKYEIHCINFVFLFVLSDDLWCLVHVWHILLHWSILVFLFLSLDFTYTKAKFKMKRGQLHCNFWRE